MKMLQSDPLPNKMEKAERGRGEIFVCETSSGGTRTEQPFGLRGGVVGLQQRSAA